MKFRKFSYLFLYIDVEKIDFEKKSDLLALHIKKNCDAKQLTHGKLGTFSCAPLNITIPAPKDGVYGF